jgi:spore coat polysaccharide biosynthesis protein SpsF (cytidylyltransferase family)
MVGKQCLPSNYDYLCINNSMFGNKIEILKLNAIQASSESMRSITWKFEKQETLIISVLEIQHQFLGERIIF